MIAALRRAGLAAPSDQAGAILAAFSAVGVFRLRGALIGTVAYQNYSGMLGVRLPDARTQTQDLDVAQFRTVSGAVSEAEMIPALLDVLRAVDPSFTALPYAHDARLASAYVNDAGYRVEVMTPNRGAAEDKPQRLPSLGTHATPL